MTLEPVIVIHGGAWEMPEDLAAPSVEGIKVAALIGYKILRSKGRAVDAVEAAIRSLEDNPAFNAGTGSVLNASGEVEMDAVIMDGKNMSCGGVACVQNIKNPITLARAVMEQTDHVLLAGKGANQFAVEIGSEIIPPEQLVTEEVQTLLERFKKCRSNVHMLFRNRGFQGHDTVGAVALDTEGNVAYGTSTGGITAKHPGRVGDSPIIGAGGYADNKSGAVSTTGHGESIIKVCLARQIIHLIEQGMSPQKACESALATMTTRVAASGGAVSVSNKGEIGKHFSADRMAWSWIKGNELHYGLNTGEDFMEKL